MAGWPKDAALRWLEDLGVPEMILPAVERRFERSCVTFYVPVNDRAGPSAATIQSCPAITRGKQPRTYPRTWVGNTPCFLHWSNVEGVEQHREPLDRLCRKVTRLGHSSSLVRMWIANAADSAWVNGEHYVQDDRLSEVQARSFSAGTLDMLAERFGEKTRREHAERSQKIADRKAEKKAIRGKGALERKAQIDEEIDQIQEELSQIVPRPPVRPTIGLWSGYRRVDHGRASAEIARGHFDPDILVLSQGDGPALPIISTLEVTRAFRKKVLEALKECGLQPVPDWASGHLANGQPLRDGNGHLAIVPLPYVGREHADGHLMGVAFVFPASVEPQERGRVLGRLLMDEATRQPKTLELGPLGDWRKSDWSERRWTLQPETWTASPNGAETWASATPVVLDRFPKAKRNNPTERPEWEDEVRQIVREACTRIGLPAPERIDIDTTSWHRGSPRAVSKRRPLRGPAGPGGVTEAAVGDGFPPYPAKGTNAPRPQVHVWLRFAQPVIGPVLLGAGRFLGYGLCKPWREDRS